MDETINEKENVSKKDQSLFFGKHTWEAHERHTEKKKREKE